MTSQERTCGTRVELIGRETLPTPASGRRDRIEAQLADLASAGAVASFDVSTWPKRIPRDGGDDAGVRDRYLAFSAWARERGVRLAPFFGVRECYSTETGERGEWLVLPALCLAVYGGDGLVAVYPHTDGDTYRSVLSGVQSLSDRRGGTDSPPAPTAD